VWLFWPQTDLTPALTVDLATYLVEEGYHEVGCGHTAAGRITPG
jgi:hypothetical protein